MAVSTEDEIEALRWEVRELRKEVARLRAAQADPCCQHTGTHPAYQTPWREVIRGGDGSLRE